MGIFTGLRTGAETLSAHATALNAVADNIANQNTHGFKTSRVEFADLLAGSVGNLLETPLASGNGVRTTALSLNLKQGTIEPTGRELDIAIDGQGFFIVRQAAAETPTDYYTRAGNFQTDVNGFLVMPSGEQVMGFTTESPTTLVPLNVRNVQTAATPTTTIEVFGNLNSGAPIVTAPAAAPATFAALAADSDFTNTVRIIDSLGAEHDVAIHYFHTGNLTWTAQAYADGAETGGTAGAPVLLGSTTITVDTNGAQAEGATSVIALTTGWSNGATASAVNIGLTNFTGFSTSSAVSAVTADGASPSSVQSIAFGAAGNVEAILSNGNRSLVGTIALADFRNRDGLTRIGDNKFAESATTGEKTAAAAGSGDLGSLRGQSLELSNVDPANEFVAMVQYQRGYQAGSQVISTFNEIIKSTIQLA